MRIFFINLIFVLLVACPAVQGAITIAGFDFSVPTSGNNGSLTGTSPSQAFVDDIILEGITVMTSQGQTRFSVSDSQVVVGVAAFVRAELDSLNAEFGDADDGADGNPNPFVEIGVVPEGAPVPSFISESTDPFIQNASISAAVASFSLTQGVDGEGANFTFDVIFGQGIRDNDDASDQIPEFVLLERGFNSSYSLRAIIGGTSENPIFAPFAVDVPVSAQSATGIFINTTEVGNGQQLASFGVDLSDFGVMAGEAVFGLSITSTNNTGADITAQFITAQDVSQLVELPEGLAPTVPEPSAFFLLMLASLFGLRRRRSR